MSVDKYIASTLATDTSYVGYRTGSNGNDLPTVTHSVTIKGGAGVANKNLITPHGVITKVSAEDAEFLAQNSVFQRHVARGFLQLLDSKPEDADAVAGDMDGSDPGQPLTPAHYEGTGQKAPTTGKQKR